MFQSTPAITDGRRAGSCGVAFSVPGFNPRPPSLTGDAGSPMAGDAAVRCFNPRPPSLTGDAFLLDAL